MQRSITNISSKLLMMNVSECHRKDLTGCYSDSRCGFGGSSDDGASQQRATAFKNTQNLLMWSKQKRPERSETSSLTDQLTNEAAVTLTGGEDEMNIDKMITTNRV